MPIRQKKTTNPIVPLSDSDTRGKISKPARLPDVIAEEGSGEHARDSRLT
jgi:hypothetical protein